MKLHQEYAETIPADSVQSISMTVRVLKAEELGQKGHIMQFRAMQFGGWIHGMMKLLKSLAAQGIINTLDMYDDAMLIFNHFATKHDFLGLRRKTKTIEESTVSLTNNNPLASLARRATWLEHMVRDGTYIPYLVRAKVTNTHYGCVFPSPWLQPDFYGRKGNHEEMEKEWKILKEMSPDPNASGSVRTTSFHSSNQRVKKRRTFFRQKIDLEPKKRRSIANHSLQGFNSKRKPRITIA